MDRAYGWGVLPIFFHLACTFQKNVDNIIKYVWPKDVMEVLS